MRFGRAILAGYRNTFNVAGTATVDEYWWFAAWQFTLIIAMGAGAILGVILVGMPPKSLWPVVACVAVPGVAAASTVLPLFTAQIRRVRDAGHSRLWVAAWVVLMLAQTVLSLATTQEGAASLCGILAGGLSLLIFVYTVQPSRGAKAP